MKAVNRESLVAANEELRGVLNRVSRVANNTELVSEGDWRSVLQRITRVAPQVGDASRASVLDSEAQQYIAEYVHNLGELQILLVRMQCVTLARKVQV